MADDGRWEGDVVLADGGVVHLRPVRPDDADAVVAFHHRQSPESLYYRYFSPKPSLTADEVEHLTTAVGGDNLAFVAFDGDDLIGIGRYDRLRAGNEAEVAFQADEAHRGRGLATLFLEYLIAAAREAGFDRLVAQVLPDNRRMLAVFERAGFEAHRQFADGVIEVELGLDDTPTSRAAIQDREQRAEARSVAHLLRPAAVAVVAGEGPVGDPARDAHTQLVAHDFAGPVVRVGVAAAWERPAVARIEDVPGAVDLAVVAVAPTDLEATIDACAAKRVRGVVLLTPADAPDALVARVRRAGLRLVGPGALGIVNPEPEVRLRASPLPGVVAAGPIGFLSQSGSLASALLDRAAQFGLGFSSVVMVGDKADVSANDLLQYWEHDEGTRVVALYLQSFGNPRKFSRIARRVSREKPVVAVKSGRGPVDADGEEWPDDMADALMRQTGVIRVDTTEDLLDVTRVLATQPVPEGERVAVVANRNGPARVAVDACAGGGLVLAEVRLLEGSAPPAAWAAAVEEVLGAADGVLVVWSGPATESAGPTLKAVGEVAAAAAKPVVATTVGRNPTVGPVPTFSFPERAARSLGRAAAYGTWRARPPGVVPSAEELGVDVARARAVVDAALADAPEGRALTVEEIVEVLGAFGLRSPGERVVTTADEAAAAAEELGGPLALKALAIPRLGKSEAQGLALDLPDPDEVRAAFGRLEAQVGDGVHPALLQRMVPPGADVLVDLHQHPQWGSTVSLGVGGAVGLALDDRALRVVPLTDLSARRMVDTSPAARILEDSGSTADRAPLEDLLLRVSTLADLLPEVRRLRFNPVIVGPEVAWITSAWAQVRPWTPGPDPDLRRL